MSDHPQPQAAVPATTRRTVLRAAGLAALAGGGATVLGACSADGEPAAPSTSAPTSSAPASSSAPATSAPASSTPATPSATKTSAAPSGPSVATADVPVGGGVIMENADYVVTQPEKGTYKAFSKICTHMRCPVTSVSDGLINCSCHGSKFSIEDGSVSGPPATEPLPEAKAVVSGGKVYVEA